MVNNALKTTLTELFSPAFEDYDAKVAALKENIKELTDSLVKSCDELAELIGDEEE